MIKSYKNKEFISKLNNKELEDYYNCYRHHHSMRNYCKNEAKSKDISLTSSTSCLKDEDHFCTGNSKLECTCCNAQTKCLASTEHSLIVCENYAPSYTSKTDQINDLKKEVSQMKKSKQLLKKAMQDLDKLLGEDDVNNDDGLNEVERFYRSDKFIGSSIHIKNLHKDLPRQDIQPPKYIYNTNLNKKKDTPEYGTSLFSYYNKNLFADRDLLEKEAGLKSSKVKKPAKPSVIELRAKSAVVLSRNYNLL